MPNTTGGQYFEITDNETGEVFLGSADSPSGEGRSYNEAREAAEAQAPKEYFKLVDIGYYGPKPRGYYTYHPLRDIVLGAIAFIVFFTVALWIVSR